jgi:Mycothiol maleylpyruvate isomerase N-terminal domain
VETRDAVRDEMLDLIERLAAIDHEQSNSPSLCARWRIRDVLAHVTAGAEGAFGVGTISWGVLRKRDLPEPHLVAVANFVKDDRLIFGARRRIAAVKLTATDMDWSHGQGPEVTGPAEALVMMMAGRKVALDDLSGEGKVTLATRR